MLHIVLLCSEQDLCKGGRLIPANTIWSDPPQGRSLHIALVAQPPSLRNHHYTTIETVLSYRLRGGKGDGQVLEAKQETPFEEF